LGFGIWDLGFDVIHLSVNVNKVATLRNSRGGSLPSVLDAVRVCVQAGARGITVHPRADARHITATDVREIAALLPALTSGDAAGLSLGDRRQDIEFNIEGDPRPDLLQLVHAVRPAQCTLVPVRPGEITSQAGWASDTPREMLARVIAELRAAHIRVSVFVDAMEAPIRWAADVGADRVELYTEPFARAFELGEANAMRSFETYRRASELAHTLGLGVNAGHDLNLENLRLFRTLPYLDEVSIGHALISHALFVGLARSVDDYLRALEG
jgi:pyridoxine 5-phosphate synthase